MMSAAVDRPLAGFWLRFWASMIDTLCLALLLVPMLLWVYGLHYFSGRTGWFHGPADVVIQILLPFVLVFWCWKKWLATPGKMLFAAEIVDSVTGQAPTSFQLTVRYLGYFVSLIPIGLGFFWILWDPRKQGWHDKLAGTVVRRIPEQLTGRRRNWLIAFSLATLLLTVLALGSTGVWIFVNRVKIETTVGGLLSASEEGLFYGLGLGADECLKRATKEMADCPAFLCAYESSLFLNGCLQSSRYSPEFCAQVPVGWGNILAGSWQSEQCQQLNRSSLGCLQLFSVQMMYCQEATKVNRPE